VKTVKVGDLTFRCQTCGDRFGMPVSATAQPDGVWSLSLDIDQAEIVMFTLWGQAHQGPIGP